MHKFNQLYRAYMESTRRDFIKQVTGAIAGTAGLPSSVSSAPIASDAGKAAFNFGYELSSVINIPTLTHLFKDLWAKKKKYTPQQLQQHVEKSYRMLKSAKRLDKNSIKMLIAYSGEALQTSAGLKAQQAHIAAMRSNLNAAETKELMNYFNLDANLEQYLDMVSDFFATGNQEIFEHLWPLDIMVDNKIIMTKQQALQQGLFRPLSSIKAEMQHEIDTKIKEIKDVKKLPPHNDIEYSPADYKGGWQHDADYQSLSMGESTKPKTTASHCSKDAQSISLLYEQLAQAPAPVAAPQPTAQQQQPAAPQQQQPVANAPAFALRTFGDIKAIINRIKNKQKVAGIAAAGADVAIDAALNLIPGLGAAKTAFAFFKAATSRPDTQKTNTFIDQLDVDDSMSKIVDNTVENEFLQSIESIISKYPDKEPLPANWNMTNELVKFLRNKYKNSPAVLQHLTDITTRMQPAASAAPMA